MLSSRSNVARTCNSGSFSPEYATFAISFMPLEEWRQ
jgi:hypothetical protein